MRRAWHVLAVALVATGVPTGCTTIEDPVPDDAVLLRANIPTDVAGLTVVAGNVEEDRAVLSVADGTAPATVLDARVGDTVEALGVSLTLVATRVGGDDKPGLPDAAAWVVVDEG